MIEYVPMKKEHIEGMVKVEEQCFNSGFAEKTFNRELENKIAIYIVAIENNEVLGYGGMWNICGVGDIMDIAVDKGFRRRGIGRGILNALMQCAKGEGIGEINLEVRVSNHGAISLYEGFGFSRCGLRPRYYENREDAILMKYELKEE